MLLTTSAEMRSASSTGTALAVRMLNVREKRAVFRPRMSLPTSGTRSRNRSTLQARLGGLDPARESPDDRGDDDQSVEPVDAG